jgi:2-polyprenyl-6-methoxyphenol hydroxylase-like FAD-dependent oxidoreductase
VITTDILIVGAGPVGLFLANECARRKLRWRLIEARAGQSEHSKALAIMPRTLEIFDMAGIAGPFLGVANRVTKVAVISRGHRLAQIRFAPGDTPYPFVAMVPQDETERLLVGELRRKGGAVEYETRFVSASQHADHVVVKLDHKGTSEEVTARFVVGCDGAHSDIRHLLDLSFEGAAYDASFMLADIETDEALPADEMQLCPSAAGPLAIFPMSATRRRMVATVDGPAGEAPSLNTVRQALVERGPGAIEVRGLRWSSYFRIHHRQVNALRVGRIFVAGDAAHIHSPMGGQGMNTGLQDAWNLAWKLDMALHDRGGEQLLDSYTVERVPIIKGVIQTTHFITRAMGMPNRIAQALRDTVIPIVSRLPAFQRAFVRRLSQLGVSYRGSPLVRGSGERYFDDSVRGGSGIVSRFVLFAGPGTDAATISTLKELCEAFNELVEFRYTQQQGVALIRPDGYTAYRNAQPSAASIVSQLRSLLHLQTM